VNLTLEIVVPDQTVLDTTVRSVKAVDATGSFALLPGHENFCAALVPSILTYCDADDVERYVAVDSGVLLLEGNRVSVATREAVASNDLEGLADALASMVRARREQEQAASKSFARLVAQLLQQLPQMESRL
jgi:F-type H+-transporting ATPase subunit epsilon